MELPNKYESKEMEQKWQEFWEQNNTFVFNPEDVAKEIYEIDTPPPTVSGKMHLGHAFGNSQQDFVARYKRMKGYNVLQPFGTDDNGLPTKLLVEKLKKVRANDLVRSEFRDLCLKTLNEELKPEYTQDWKRLGISCDFKNATYSTIDPHAQKISQKSFLDLYKAGRQYRAEAPAMFCPKCQTAISQVECEDVDMPSFFNDIVFKTTDDSGTETELLIATTRPELLPACVSVFYNPEDTRYHHLKGKMAKVPLFDFEVPILEDPRADPEKGTGLVMCCTFGDQTDMEWQKAHNLPIKEAIGQHGKMTDLAGAYAGLKIEDARKKIISDMKEANLLLNQKSINHAVNVHERCGTPIEFIHSKQWFVKYLDLKDDMLAWGNELDWRPSFMKNRYDNWVKGLQWDWCISRQIPFGIPFPVWYCKSCDATILAKEDELPVDPVEQSPSISTCPKCGGAEFIPETDVINTWATSSLTPTIVRELFVGTPYYTAVKGKPFALRPQGHDIISFWLFNTVVKSQLHYQRKPWDVCFINGWMLDPKGKKMSKSKGNVIPPQEIMDKYSADALRYMAASCKLGDDLAFPEKDVITGKKTITKLFNASKFVHMHLEDYDASLTLQDVTLESIDKWLLAKYNETVQIATEYFEEYNFSRAKAEIDLFFWRDLCDNYLEIVKDRLYNPDVHGVLARQSAQATLYHVLNGVLRLFAPIMPFITEEIYSWKFKQNELDSIHLQSWPMYESAFTFEKEMKAGDLACDVIGVVRKYKSDHAVSQKNVVESLVLDLPLENKSLLELVKKDIAMTVTANEISFGKATEVSVNDSFHMDIVLAPKEEKQ